MKQKGFTLLEIVIVISITMLMVGFTISSFRLLNQSQALSKNADTMGTILREARSMTLSSKNGTQYGVHLETNQAVIFTGAVYSSTTPSNLYYPLNSLGTISSINLTSSSTEVVFDRLTGDTPQSGTIILNLLNNPSSTRTINVSSTGLIEVLP